MFTPKRLIGGSLLMFVLAAAALAQEFGFTDIDGKQPRPLTLQDV